MAGVSFRKGFPTHTSFLVLSGQKSPAFLLHSTFAAERRERQRIPCGSGQAEGLHGLVPNCPGLAPLAAVRAQSHSRLTLG